MDQPSLFDVETRRHATEATRQATEAAIQAADDHADKEWRAAALASVLYCAKTMDEFTTDEVWSVLEQNYPNLNTHEPAAMGPVMLRAARDGVIVKSGRTRLSVFSRRHRDLTIWLPSLEFAK